MMDEKEVKQEETTKKEKKFIWTWKGFFLSFLWVSVLVIAIDLASKWGVVNFFKANPQLKGSLEVIPHFFYLTLSYNKGSSFGMGSDISWMRYVFIVISWLASAGIIYYWYKNLNKKDHLVDCILMLALGGAIGNAIDRTFYWDGVTGFSGVVDFFQFYIFGYNNDSFAIFNVADAALVVAMMMLIVLIVVRSIKEAVQKK
ncbi:MAG TPA: signal peptidase II [Firmicutes bacterium]|nr:signal peptidase II [Bacillota bacterium]